MATAGSNTTGQSALGVDPRKAMPGLEENARAIADRLPELLVDAKRVSQTVAHGVHGRRRAGPGETFWQFRPYESTDSAQLIDWRRSASSDHLYVREREWEAAHTVWVWSDLSPSMAFQSHLSRHSKRDRAVVLMLAVADLLVRAGERVGLMGLSQPTASRRAATILGETIVANAYSHLMMKSRPPKQQLVRFSDAILFGDFLAPIAAIRERLEFVAASGSKGHIVQILDPAEETLPYEGRLEFVNASGRERFLADRAQSLRSEYQARLQAHRAEIEALCHRLGWSFMVHHTDRPATEPLLALFMMMSSGASSSFRRGGSAVDAGIEGG
ncbi:MAG: DUF58 domain-containing protein [Hyphomicrobium sp.]|nr:DUF58 domain-containing protein [Hyphomicrobium sp.]